MRIRVYNKKENNGKILGLIDMALLEGIFDQALKIRDLKQFEKIYRKVLHNLLLDGNINIVRGNKANPNK